jgi:hypothetical protein
MAAGISIPVTGRVRRLFFGLGLAIPAGKSEIKIPGRPWIAPVFQHEQANIQAHFDQRFGWGFEQLSAGATRITSPDTDITSNWAMA